MIKKLLQLVLILFLPAVLFANEYSYINYTVTPFVNENTPKVIVETEIQGNLSEKLVLKLPDHWAGIDYTKQIKNIKIKNAKYKFTVKRKNTHELSITIPKEINSIQLSYEIYQKPKDPANVHETIIRKDLIHAPGYGLFACPKELKDTDRVQFNIKWQNLPKKWLTISSQGTTGSLQVTSIKQLMPAIYVAGKIRMYQIIGGKSPVFLSLYGTFNIKDELLISYLENIIHSQRSFFNDYNFPYYAISLIEGDDPHSMGGTRLHNCFTAYLSQGCGTKLDYYILIAHEHLHTWIGGKIVNKYDQEELNYWWTEGFTDYYSRVLALRSGGISIDEFILECNQLLKKYYLSPVLNEPNIRIKQDFWENSDVEKLPYYRGFVFAIYLNNIIKKNNINHSLDNIMLDLFNSFVKSHEQKKFSVEQFKSIAKKYVPEGIDEQIINFIDQGKTIDLGNLMAVLPLKIIRTKTKEFYQFKSNLSSKEKDRIKQFFGFRRFFSKPIRTFSTWP